MEQPISVETERREELRALMRAVAARDGDALGAIYERTSAKLYGIVVHLLGDEAEAQDVLQDVYVTVWNKAASFDENRASPITWLAALTRNRAIDRLRSRSARVASLSDDPDAAAAVADDRPSSFDVLEQAEDSFRLRRCLDQLEERARTMIRTAFFDGVTYPELAAQAGLPLPTVKSLVRRGLMRLRRCLEQ